MYVIWAELVRLRGKYTEQSTHCALVKMLDPLVCIRDLQRIDLFMFYLEKCGVDSKTMF